MSIRFKLTALILAFVFIPLIVVNMLTFTQYQDSLEHARILQLQELARFKAERIDACFAGFAANIEMAQSFYNIKKNLPVLIQFYGNPSNVDAVTAKKVLDEQFQRAQKVMGLSDIMLTDSLGRVVYVCNPEHQVKDYGSLLPENEQNVFKLKKDSVYFSDVFLNRAHGNKFEMLVTATAFNLNNRPIGIIAFEVDMAPIYSLIQDTAGLGKTGEVLVGKKIGDKIQYLNPLRHDPSAALKRSVGIGDRIGLPIQKAIFGEQGADQSIDYRGKNVIAAWRYISSLEWGLVAKIDSDEAFAAVINLKRLVIFILIFVFAIVTVIIFFVARSIAEPIRKLSEGAAIIGKGNLDYKVGTKRKDEIGHLSRAFDNMTHNLKEITASRDELDQEIIERKMAEQDLKRSNENLEQFAYVASHDLQEPLRAMGSFSQLLETRYKSKLDGDAVEFLGFIVDAANRMQKLITDLLAYSRIGRTESAADDVDCNSVLDKVIAGLRSQIEESGAIITNDNLPVSFCNESEWIQLFQNLIGNAIKFRGNEPPRIHIGAKKKGREWEFLVRDNGIGIDNRYKDRIFLIFQRLHGRDKYPGTGIGLSICKKIVETRGGEIWLESETGKGSTFYFTIPDKTKKEAIA